MILRSVIFNCIFYFSTPFIGIVFLPILFSRRLTFYIVRIWAKFIIFSFRKIFKIKIQFVNKYIQKNRGYLIAANHQSIFDTIFFLTTFDKVIYIVKKELKHIPIYGWYAGRLGHIFLDRKQKIKSMKVLTKDIKNLIKKGYKVIIFPEGTRQFPNTLGVLKPGIFAMQLATQSKVYPIYLKTGIAWPKKGMKKYKKKILISCLRPIQNSENKKYFLKLLKNRFLNADKDLKVKSR